jgi:hypothetical protein
MAAERSLIYNDEYRSYLTLWWVFDQGPLGKVRYSLIVFLLLVEIMEFAALAVESWFGGSRSLLRHNTQQIMGLVTTPSRLVRALLPIRSNWHIPLRSRRGVSARRTMVLKSVGVGVMSLVPEVLLIILSNLGGIERPSKPLTYIRVENAGAGQLDAVFQLKYLPSGYSGANPVVLTPKRGVFFSNQLLSVALQREDLEDFINHSEGKDYVGKNSARDESGCVNPEYSMPSSKGVLEVSCDKQFSNLRVGCVVKQCNRTRLLVLRVDSFDTATGEAFSASLERVDMAELAAQLDGEELPGRPLYIIEVTAKDADGFKARSFDADDCDTAGILAGLSALILRGMQVTASGEGTDLLKKRNEYGSTCQVTYDGFSYENRSSLAPPIYVLCLWLTFLLANVGMRLWGGLPWYSRSYKIACETMAASCTSDPWRSSAESCDYGCWRLEGGVTLTKHVEGVGKVLYNAHCGMRRPEPVRITWKQTQADEYDVVWTECVPEAGTSVWDDNLNYSWEKQDGAADLEVRGVGRASGIVRLSEPDYIWYWKGVTPPSTSRADYWNFSPIADREPPAHGARDVRATLRMDDACGGEWKIWETPSEVQAIGFEGPSGRISGRRVRCRYPPNELMANWVETDPNDKGLVFLGNANRFPLDETTEVEEIRPRRAHPVSVPGVRTGKLVRLAVLRALWLFFVSSILLKAGCLVTWRWLQIAVVFTVLTVLVFGPFLLETVRDAFFT